MPADPTAGIFTPRSVPAPSGAGVRVRPVAQVAHNHREVFTPTVKVTPRVAPKPIPGGPAPGPSAKHSVVFLTPAQIEEQAQAHAAQLASQRAARAQLAHQQPEATASTGLTGSEVVNQHTPIYSPRPGGIRGPLLPPTGPTHDIYSRLILKQMATMRSQDPTFAQKTLAEQESAARAYIGSARGPAGDPSTQWNAQQVSEADQMRLKNLGLPRVILEQVAQGLMPVATAERLAHGQAPSLGSVASDVGTGLALLGPDELLAPVRAARAGLSAYREAGVSADSVRAAKAALDARKGAKQAKSVFALDLRTNQARKDYTATLKAAGYSRQEQKSILSAHDASALAMSRDLGIKPSDAWDRIYAHTQYNPINVTTQDLQTGRVVFAQEGKRPEIANLAHTPDTHTAPPSPNFFKNAARRLVSSHPNALPEEFNTPTKFSKLLDELRQRAVSAAEYKDWYAKSAQGIMAHVEGNTAEADKLAALVAIYSPRAEVYSKSSEWNNLDRAINAYNEFHSTGEISPRWSISSHKTGEEDWQTFRAQQIMQGNFDWQGLKTNRFYRNFLQHIDPEKYAQLFGTERFGTMDTWMRRAFRYPAKYKTEAEQTLFGEYQRAVGKAQEPITPKMYSLMEKATQVVADSLGWSPEEAQAAIWTSIKAEQEGTPLSQAGFDFGDAFAHRNAREASKPTTWEQLLTEERPQVKKFTRDEAWNMEPDPAYLYHGTSPEAAASIDQGKAIHAMPTERDPSQQAVWLSEHPSRAATQGGVVYGIPRELIPQDLLGKRMAFGTYATSGDVHFGGNMARETQRVQIANEAKPGDAAVFAGERAFYDALTPGEQASYANEVFKVTRPGTFEKIVGLDSQGHHMGIGVWRGGASVGTANHVIVPELTAKEIADLNAVASAKGIIQSQDSVSWGRPLAAGKTGDNIYPGFLIRPPENTPESMAALGAKIDAEFGAGWVGIIHGPEGAYYLVDFSGADNFANRLTAMVHDISPRVEPISWEGGYVEDARAAQEGAWGVTYQDAISQHPQSEALQAAIDKAQGQVEKIRSDFSEFSRERAGQRYEEALAEAAAMMGKKVPKNGTIGNRQDRKEVLQWLAAQARQTDDPQIHAVADTLDQAIEAHNSPDPEFFFQEGNPLLRSISNEQDKPMFSAAAMQVRYAGMNPDAAAAMFNIKPEELRAYLSSGEYEKEQARILSNADVGAGAAATTEDAKTILDRAEGKLLPQDAGIPIKGAVARTTEGEHILHLFQGADVSTAIHELGHAVEQYLPKELRDALGNDPETIARTFEQYFKEGGIPNEAMRPAMDHIAEQLARIYGEAASVPNAKISPEIKAAFDDFFTREIKRSPELAQRMGAAFLGQRGHNWRWPSDATDQAKALAEEHGVDPAHIVGTGVDGRITIPDVEKYVFEQMKPEDQLRSVMRGLRIQRGKQEAGYSVERSARFKKAEGHFQNETLPPEERLQAGKSELVGELPKVVIGGHVRDMTQDSLDHLLATVLQHPNLMTGQKTRVADALVALIREGRTPTKSELSLMRHVWGKDTVNSLQEMASKWHQGYNLALSALNIPRSIMSSMDVSFGLRQALVAAFYDPKTWWRAWRGQFEYLSKYTGGGEEAYQALMESVYARPNYPLYQDMGLAITDLETEIGMREEQYQSNLAEKLTVKGHGPGTAIRASGRMYTGMAIRLRTELADKLLVDAAANGKDIHNADFLKELGHFINGITGRGDLPGKVLQESAPLLNATFFSPRLLASRVQMLNPRNYILGDDFVRRQYLRAGLSTFGSLAAILATIKLFVPGAKVGTDWRSSDFGKIKVGDTRIDIGGGFNQLFHLMGEIYTGQKVSSTTGRVSSLTSNKFGQATRSDAFISFFTGKLAPTPSMISDWAKNRDPQHLGQPFNWKDEATSHFEPLIAQDAWQLYNDPAGGLNGIEAAAAGYGLEATGVGIQTYKATDPSAKQTKKITDEAKQLGLPAPTPDILLDLKHKSNLDSLSSANAGDAKGRMNDYIKYYEQETGDKSFEQVAKLVTARGTDADAKQITDAIRHALIGPGLSPYEKAIRDAQKVATP